MAIFNSCVKLPEGTLGEAENRCGNRQVLLGKTIYTCLIFHI